MNKSDTDCIKYLFNEMDPSEEIIYERELERDSDLLIEVESLKSVNNKLKTIPLFNPPEKLSELVFTTSYVNRQRRKKEILSGIILAAAVLFLTITFGIFLIDNPASTADTTQSQASLNTGILLIPEEPTVKIEYGTESVKPWTDRNEVLYFTGFGASGSAFENNSQKLELVENDRATRTSQRNFHLTGSSN